MIIKILQYMSMHAHPQVDYKTEINVFLFILFNLFQKVMFNIPENVAQQILIWEEEKNTVQTENGNFYDILTVFQSFICLSSEIKITIDI